MLERTFLHIPGVGPKRELALWRAGLDSWERFLARGPSLAPRQVWGLGRPVIERSLAALAAPHGLNELAAMIPPSEHWRFFPRYGRAAYLDIETGGEAGEWGGVTVVGVWDGRSLRQYLAGRDMQELDHALMDFELVVTFGGSGFDLPVLRSVFPRLRLPPVQVDLRWLLKRIGLTGGLKRIERRLDIGRSQPVQGLGGYDAVRLWAEHQKGSAEALSLLLEYNAYDCVNLEPLLKLGVERLSAQLLGRAGGRG